MLAAVLVSMALSTLEPRQVSVRWSAPAPCPVQREVRGRIATLLSESGSGRHEPVTLRLSVTAIDGGFELSATSLDTEAGERVIQAARCDDLAEAAALIAAIAIDPELTVPSPTVGVDEAPADEAGAGLEPVAPSSGGIPSPEAPQAAEGRLGMKVRGAATPVLGMLPVEFGDDIAKHIRESIDASLARGVVRSGVAAQAMPSRAAANPAVRQFITGRVTQVGRDFTVELELVDRSGARLAIRREACELCGVTEVSETADNLAAGLATTFADWPRGPGFLRLDSDPSGAKVRVDGESVGVTPLRLELAPGRHEVATQAVGHGEARRSVEAVSGVEGTLLLRMQPIEPEIPEERQRGIMAAGWSLFGLGLGGLGAGTALLVLDERPYRPSCSEDGPDPKGRCPEQYRTLTPGATLVAVGGTALVTGVGLVIWQVRRKVRGVDGRASRRHVSRQAHVQPDLGGFTVSF